jgi:hypothetical protein
MWQCVWRPTTTTGTSESKMYIYDAGVFTGILYGDKWHVWKVAKRTKHADASVTEMLDPMPVDWVPPEVYSVEEYPLLSHSEDQRQVELQIPGWTLRVEDLSEESPSRSATHRLLNQRGILRRKGLGRRRYSKTGGEPLRKKPLHRHRDRIAQGLCGSHGRQ